MSDAAEHTGEIYVMDRSGHRSTFRWGKTQAEIDRARNIFNDYVENGFTMYRLTTDGEEGRKITRFDPDAPGILAVPRMVGG